MRNLKKLAEENHLFYQHFSCDLSNLEQVESISRSIAEAVLSKNPNNVYVFNNAGMIEPIETVGHLDRASVIANAQVNLLAPILISNIFLEKALNTKLVIVNVTSGAAVRPIQGWSTYCSTKAGLNMFTQTAALEQKTAGNKHTIIAFSPGVMDTDMQGTIRSSSQESFHDVETFKEYKEQGMLRSTNNVANALIDLVFSNKVESGTIYHVNELLK